MAETQPRKSIFKRVLLILALILIAGLGITYLIFNFTYSEGNRAGVLIKFSKKGFIFKTYEGELNIGGLGNVPGTAQVDNHWDFSVTKNNIADSLMSMEGKKVSLHYREVIKNVWWEGETKYFVDGVKVIE